MKFIRDFAPCLAQFPHFAAYAYKTRTAIVVLEKANPHDDEPAAYLATLYGDVVPRQMSLKQLKEFMLRKRPKDRIALLDKGGTSITDGSAHFHFDCTLCSVERRRSKSLPPRSG